jgi:hypothetical protein
MLLAYLIVYFALLAGALLTLWQTDILRQIPRPWTVLAVLVSVGLGLLLAVVARHPRRPASSAPTPNP